jgi:hypothetical protein
MQAPQSEREAAARRARTRRLALLLGLVAVGFYAGFIVLGLVHGPR